MCRKSLKKLPFVSIIKGPYHDYCFYHVESSNRIRFVSTVLVF